MINNLTNENLKEIDELNYYVLYEYKRFSYVYYYCR